MRTPKRLESCIVSAGLMVIAGTAGCGNSRAPNTRRDTGTTTVVDNDVGVTLRGDSGQTVEIDARTLEFDAGPSGNCTPGADSDGDGFSGADDCNDCSPQINVGAFDFPGNSIDEDCDGTDATTADAVDCDASLSFASMTPEDAARAIGLCRFTTESSRSWGVISARFTRANGSGAIEGSTQTGVLPGLGAAHAIAGANLFALSTGIARAPGQPGYVDDACTCFGPMRDPLCDPFFEDCDVCSPTAIAPHGVPAGASPTSSACPGVVAGAPYNSAALEVRIRVPTNARSFVFRSSFYTTEYPAYICSTYNDYFAVLREENGSYSNIVFDSMNNTVSVNSGFLAVCSPGNFGGRNFACPMGTGLLANTGFSNTARCGSDLLSNDPMFPPGGQVGGSTGWLRTQAAVQPGAILVLRFAIWDSGDGNLDSTALVDGWEWDLDEVSMTPMTEPEIPS